MLLYIQINQDNGNNIMELLKNKQKIRNIVVIIIIAIMCGIIFFYQTKKVGFHEDEGYTLASSVNPTNGLMVAYDESGNTEGPVWKTREFVKDYVTLAPENIFNFWALYHNQAGDNHPPFFYTLVHFSTLFFGGEFSKYSVFIVIELWVSSSAG